MASVTGVSSGDYYLPDDKIRVPKKKLDMNDFITLLVEQLKNQDPLEPQSNQEFVAQMAQISSLETMGELSNNMKFTKATMLIGKNVTVNYSNKKITGIVEKVAVVDDTIKVYINDIAYDLKDVIQVEDAEKS